MIGQMIAHYEVLELIGQGGMGEVYRARDTELERDVALKVLPGAFVDDAERLARFQREARVLASLQHQNIAAIYGLEEAAGQPVLVMELAEGEDLSVRIGRGPLPADEVAKIARQLARGLEYAHEQGVVHRDLKPANVKVAGDGRVKILDFGLARAFSAGPDPDPATGDGQAHVSHSPTITQALTVAGTVLGTAAYMSPEQARGREVDKRADIWAVGVILYEMLTGWQLFAGETATDILAAILREDPDWETLPPDTPPQLVQLCQRCLEKDPQLRLRDIGEVRVAFEGSSASMLSMASAVAMPPPEAAPSGRRSPLPWLLVAGLAVALVAVGLLGMRGMLGPEAPPTPVVRSQVQLPEGVNVYLNPVAPGPVKVSPDGRHLAFSGQDSSGRLMLYLRSLDQREARVVPGSDGAVYPFWSADSRSVAFFASSGLRRVDISGGPVITICQAANGKSGSWGADGTIIFAPAHNMPLQRVPAAGGTPEDVTSFEPDAAVRSHRFPEWLPDGRHFIYLVLHQTGSTATSSDATLRLGSIDGSTDRELMPCQTNAVHAGGELLFAHDQILMARPFSLAELAFTGPARPLEADVLMLREAHVGVFSAVHSDEGNEVLAYTRGDGRFGLSRHHWIGGGTTGGTTGAEVLGEPIYPMGFEISPDGKQVALSIVDPQNGTFDIWLHENVRQLRTRFTFDKESESWPIWSPDGRSLTYAADQNGSTNILRKAISGGGQPEVLVTMDSDIYPTAWSPDGKVLVFSEMDSGGDMGLWLLDTSGDGQPILFRDTEFSEGFAAFSPDGRWLTYTSSETGRWEIFVEAVELGGGRWRISANGGVWSVWSADGTRIYYLDGSGELMATQVASAPDGLRIGETATIDQGVEMTVVRTFDEDPVSGRLLVQRLEKNQPTTVLTLVTGWQGALRAE